MTSQEFDSDLVNAPLGPDTVLQDRYRIVRKLGRGGMGAVYEAIDQRLGKTVALKETLSSDPSMRKQFEREARLLAGMQHPALPQVTDHFVEGNRAFLVMQFIGGVDLAKIIAQQPGPFPRDQVIAWADQLLDALIYLHSRDRQVIHRDIKPHNLKLTGTGQIALLDFGLAKSQPSDPSITASQAFFGYTRHYAPLEQIQDQRTDPRSDIYALGATLYHLLTGIKPPDAMVRASAVVNCGPDPLLPANEIHEAVGPQIAAILAKAMSQKPEDRYADASEFREALRRIGRATKPPDQRKTTARSRREEDTDSNTVHIKQVGKVRVTHSPEMNMALVASARTFGPAGATAVLAIFITLTAGILYGAQRWFPSPETMNNAAPGNAASFSQGSPTRKTERLRSTDTIAPASTKTKNTNEVKVDQQTGEKGMATDARNALPEKGPAALAKPQPASGRASQSLNSTPRKNQPRPGAPAIRLPNPEIPHHTPAPSPDSRVRTFGSSSEAPKFYRLPDGTQMVKFSDGTTRFVAPRYQNARYGRLSR